MKTVHKSVLIWFSAEEMFQLVTDVSRYPEFLPWCDRASIVTQNADGVDAQIGMHLAGFKKSFTTRNTHELNRRIKLLLLDGPFKHLDGEWEFIPVDGQRACRVNLILNYSFESMFGALVGPLFDKIVSTLMDAFVKRAEQIYP
ncbi:MAG: type II toxin-antitoxin system RatA family toxin [Limnohabitans sp.]|nr:type II toxin-antitoxin system RatA family toxin [Limnohabitans sp.]